MPTIRHCLTLTTCLALVAPPCPVDGQSTSDTSAIARAALAARDSLEATGAFKVGLSIGWRHLLRDRLDYRRSVSISPIDSTLQVDRVDAGDVVLSGTVVAFPFNPVGPSRTLRSCGWCALGFLANVNLAVLSPESVASFNKSIEGGIGLATSLSSHFALGITVERAFSRRLRDHFEVGRKIVVDGNTVTALAVDDGRFFVDDNMTALSVKFLYFFK